MSETTNNMYQTKHKPEVLYHYITFLLYLGYLSLNKG